MKNHETYYGIKKLRGKRKEHSLETTDRKTAERNLEKWLKRLDRVDAEAAKTTLKDLLDKFVKILQGYSKSIRDTEAAIIKKFKKKWKHGLGQKVGDISSSMLDEFLGQIETGLKNSSYNRYTLFLKQFFELAVDDQIILGFPSERVKKTWKRPQKPVRNVPTPHENEFDPAVLFLPSKNRQSLLPGFYSRFVNSIELEQFAVPLADLVLHMPIPEVRSEAERAIGLLFRAMSYGPFSLMT